MKYMNIKKLSIVGAIVVVLLVTYWIWENMNQPDTDALVSGNGRIEATEINISSKLSGQLEEILVDRKSTRLNSSHVKISYAVFCLKKKKKKTRIIELT